MLLALAVAALALLAFAPAALASQGIVKTATFGPDGTVNTTFTSVPNYVAVDKANHRLYVLQRDPSSKVYAFDLPGHTPTQGAAFPANPLSVPQGGGIPDISVDNSGGATQGRIYYAQEGSPTSNGKIYAFDSTGTQLTSPGFPNFPIVPATPKDLCGSAVDSAGNLYVSDYSASVKAIRKYDSTGAVGSPATISTAAQGIPCRMAFDSNNDLFVAVAPGPGLTLGASVYKYTAASGYATATLIDSGGNINGLAVDTTTTPHRLYVAHTTGVSVYQVNGTALPQLNFASGISNEWIRSVAVDPASGQIYLSDGNNLRVYAYHLATLPDSTTGAANNLSSTGATVHGTVNPNSIQVTDCHFEYTTDADFQINGFANAGHVDCASNPGSGLSAVGVSAVVNGLSPGTDYRFRLVAGNADGAGPAGSAVSFTTFGPGVSGEAATQISSTAATINAQINPGGEGTSYRFQYVSQADFDQSGYANAATIPAGVAGVGNGSADVAVSQSLTGLDPGATYHFRAVATNSSATVVGPGSALTTLAYDGASCPNPLFHTGLAANLPDCRAYEMVSPLDKSGFDVLYGPVVSSPDGAAAAYASLGVFSGSASGSYPSGYAATRGDGAWGTDPLSPPQAPYGGTFTPFVLGASADFSKQLVDTTAALAPGAVSGDLNFYVHDSGDGSYQFVATDPAHPNFNLPNFVGASSDGSQFFFETKDALGSTPAPPPPSGNNANLYHFDVASGQLKLVGVLPNGTVDPNGSHGAEASDELFFRPTPAFHPVSDHGDRVYWYGDAGQSSSGSLYLSEDGHPSKQVGTGIGITFWGASSDGSVAYLASTSHLTPDASPAGSDLYRYDATGAGQLTDLTPDSSDPGGADFKQVLGVSEDGDYVYFVATGALAAGATPGTPNIYVWHGGTTRLIGTLASVPNQLVGTGAPAGGYPSDYWRVSPNGRYLGFTFGGQLSGPHPQAAAPSNFRQAYLYDYQADSLACASCTAAPPSADVRLRERPADIAGGDANIGVFQTNGTLPPILGWDNVGQTRNVTDTGRFFFESRDPLVPADVNGKQDVYEYESGHLSLLSSGQSDSDSYFGDASASGDDAFIVTSSQLVGQDTDLLYDVYDARAGGGLASQLAGAQGNACQGDACQGAFTTPPAGAGPGTPQFQGPGNPTPKHKKAKKKKHHKAKKHHKRAHHRAANHDRRAAR